MEHQASPDSAWIAEVAGADPTKLATLPLLGSLPDSELADAAWVEAQSREAAWLHGIHAGGGGGRRPQTTGALDPA